MSTIESCRHRQDNELEVLKSIFGDELKDLRKNKQRKKGQPLDIIVTLTPQQGMSGRAEVYAQIDLHIVCAEKYPEETPEIRLENSRGLSNDQIAMLKTEIVRLAEELKGEVMIFELAQHVQKFLHQHNKPGFSSFYEEMVSRRQEQLQSEKEEQQIKEDKARQLMQDEIQKRKEALKSEFRDVRTSMESRTLPQSIPSSPNERIRRYSRRRCMSTSESSEGPLCEHRGTKILHFDNTRGERQVHCGKCLGHSTKGSIVYAGVDMTTGELLAVTEWTLKCGPTDRDNDNGETNDLQHSIKQIGSIEQELNYLHKLHHPNMVHYLNMKYSQNKDGIVIYILQEFVVGTTCTFFLSENIPMAIDMLRYVATGVLSALQYLHENNIVHRDLRDTSIHIDRTGIVKVTDYSLDKRLSDIYRSSCLAKADHDFPTIQGRGGKKLDIYRFGIILVSLFRGALVTDINTGWDINMQPDLKDFVGKCLNSNERVRWSAEQLQQHSFIRTPLDRGLTPPRDNRNKEKQDNSEPEQEPVSNLDFYLPLFGGHSRIRNEFEVLKRLGKGAFGDVFKVRNKLDGQIYAIKRIELNPKKRQLNRKITREVKLLSRLNHENVVRYYNSWIESATLDDPTRHSNSTPAVTPSFTTECSGKIHQFDSEDIEKLAPPLHDVEWNVAYESRNSAVQSTDNETDTSDDSSSSDDSDEDWRIIPGRYGTGLDSSDSVEFAEDETSQTSNPDQEAREIIEKKNDSEPTNEVQFMYIQMEFCEKSTLRTAIDNGLFEDEERVWRLFREIVEGIAHIHQQGMIHRDLKPVNIFLDSNDHVKIGDFGLATTNILSSYNLPVEIEKEVQVTDKVAGFEIDDGRSLTGEVGTALYAAPELSTKAAKAIYNQKVDIYSLGIILFEMCYKLLATGMERAKVLLGLRMKEIVLPQELNETEMYNQFHLLRWLLNHDPSQRPTSQEILSSEYLPPLQLEEAELQEMVRHTLSNSQSKVYKYLVGCCFGQQVTPAEDITYDMNLPFRGMPNSLSARSQFIQDNVRAKVVQVFRRHGGVNISTPIFMPVSGQLHNLTDSCVKLMTRNGSVVSIPHDLRTPFARYAVWNNITNLRRYAIERVYREKKVHGFHPRELYECAFDIISPTANNLMMEAELISIAWEIFTEIPELRDINFTVRLNHTSVLQAVLMYCGIEKDKYQDIYTILCDARDGKFTQFQVQTHLISLCLTDQAMETLSHLFETESGVAKIASVLRTITRRKGDAAALAKEGLQEMEIVIANAEALGVKWPIIVSPLLVHNTEQYSGVTYQIVCDSKRRRKRGGHEVIAAGGRYDNLFKTFGKVLERTGLANKESKQFGAGISVSLDKLVAAVREVSQDNMEGKFGIDVAVCCVDGLPKREGEMADVLRELWTLDLRITSLDLSTSEEVAEYCRENSVSHVVMLKCGEKGSLRVQSWERDRLQEKKINSSEIVDYLLRQTENSAPTLNRSESKINANNEVSTISNNPVNVNINFVLAERDKISGSGRRSFKNTILTQMTPVFQRISYKVPIEVFAVFLEINVIKTMVGFLEIDEKETDFQKSIQLVIDKHQRHKKYIQQICEEMSEVRNEKQRPVLVLYSLVDSRFMILM